MSNIITGWVPKKRNVIYRTKPEGIPTWVYVEAQNAKRFYNEDWEFWVWQVSREHNVSQAIAEDACIRGIKQEILRQYHVYGDHVGKWFEQYLDMEDIFSKVKHPEYIKKLDGVTTNE